MKTMQLQQPRGVLALRKEHCPHHPCPKNGRKHWALGFSHVQRTSFPATEHTTVSAFSGPCDSHHSTEKRDTNVRDPVSQISQLCFLALFMSNSNGSEQDPDSVTLLFFFPLKFLSSFFLREKLKSALGKHSSILSRNLLKELTIHCDFTSAEMSLRKL